MKVLHVYKFLAHTKIGNYYLNGFKKGKKYKGNIVYIIKENINF